MSTLAFHPLTRERWADFETLLGPRGACGGCWCMWWRITRSEFERSKGEANRDAMRSIVERGERPGLLAYDGDEPVGWCSVGPRETFPVLGRSRILRPVDENRVWSIVCLFVRKDRRGEGIARRLLLAAADWARSQGAPTLEGYPVEPRKTPMPAVFAYTGLAGMFLDSGFAECARRSPTRPIMRLDLGPDRGCRKS